MGRYARGDHDGGVRPRVLPTGQSQMLWCAWSSTRSRGCVGGKSASPASGRGAFVDPPTVDKSNSPSSIGRAPNRQGSSRKRILRWAACRGGFSGPRLHPGEPPSAPHGERRLERSRASPVFGWHNLTCHIMAIIALVRDQPRLLIEGVNAHDLAHGAMATRTPDSSSLLSKGRHAL
jgi:hypothetical protein